MSINTPKNGPETTGADLETAIQNAQSASDLEIEITLPDGSKNPCNVGEAVRTLRAKEVITQDQCSDYHEQIIKKCTELGLNPNDYLGDMKVDEIESLEKMAINIEKGEIEIPSGPDTDAPEIEFEASDSGELREVEGGNIDISEPDDELENPTEVSIYNQRLETIAEAKKAGDFYVFTGWGSTEGTHMFTAIKVSLLGKEITKAEARDLETKCKEKMRKLRLVREMNKAISDSENADFVQQQRGFITEKTPFEQRRDSLKLRSEDGELKVNDLVDIAKNTTFSQEERLELYTFWVNNFNKDNYALEGLLTLAYTGSDLIRKDLHTIIGLIPDLSDDEKENMFKSITVDESFGKPQQTPNPPAYSTEAAPQTNENVDNHEAPTPKNTRRSVRAALLLALAIIGAGSYGSYSLYNYYNTSNTNKDESAATAASAQAGKPTNTNAAAGDKNNEEGAAIIAADAPVEDKAGGIKESWEGSVVEDEDAIIEEEAAIVENTDDASTENDAELAVGPDRDTGETATEDDSEVVEDKAIVEEKEEEEEEDVDDVEVAKVPKIPFLKNESIEIDVETKVSQYGDTLVDFEKSVEKWEDNGWEVLEPFHHSYSKWGYILKKDDTIVFVLNQLLEIDQSTIPGWVQPKTW